MNGSSEKTENIRKQQIPKRSEAQAAQSASPWSITSKSSEKYRCPAGERPVQVARLEKSLVPLSSSEQKTRKTRQLVPKQWCWVRCCDILICQYCLCCRHLSFSYYQPREEKATAMHAQTGKSLSDKKICLMNECGKISFRWAFSTKSRRTNPSSIGSPRGKQDTRPPMGKRKNTG